MNAVHHLQPQAEPVEPEFTTDAPPHAEDLAAAFSEFLPLTGGDKAAAATLAAGAVIAAALGRDRERKFRCHSM